ncbi:hypothetical protein [Pedobacter mucosus]|uniref:hypothetical protein n=1 Tax=Pedobacter mucosus TaxID=2895286 RepID=UPI001EE3DC41|nr:hypothetical protein [Pedobacter mucosus]UKT63242.1 hypothetical protein LOK61_15910 [Pedobacter mucosus]
MKKLLKKVFLLFIPVLLFLIIGLFYPPNKLVLNGLIYSKLDKDSLMANVKGPRIILIGGSNLTFGLQSKIIKDSLGYNPINAGLTASIGLIYLLKNTQRFIKKGDVIVISPEYQLFFGKKSYGEADLLTLILNASPDTKNLVEPLQYPSLIKFVPKFIGSKFNPIIFFKNTDNVVGPYERKAINEYGDAFIHWNMIAKKSIPTLTIDDKFNKKVIQSIIDFRLKAESKGAKLFITFPPYQRVSFNSSIQQIKEIVIKLKQEKFALLGNPEKFAFEGNFFFDTAYHLTGKGALKRTLLLVQDLKKVLPNSK